MLVSARAAAGITLWLCKGNTMLRDRHQLLLSRAVPWICFADRSAGALKASCELETMSIALDEEIAHDFAVFGAQVFRRAAFSGLRDFLMHKHKVTPEDFVAWCDAHCLAPGKSGSTMATTLVQFVMGLLGGYVW